MVRPSAPWSPTARRGLLLALAMGVLGLEGCGEVPDPCADAPSYTRDIASVLVAEKCLVCHSATLFGEARRGAPPGLNFDALDALPSDLPGFASEITSGRMPPFDSGDELQTTPAQRTMVERWARCDYPP